MPRLRTLVMLLALASVQCLPAAVSSTANGGWKADISGLWNDMTLYDGVTPGGAARIQWYAGWGWRLLHPRHALAVAQ